jgi:hypothetical protein
VRADGLRLDDPKPLSGGLIVLFVLHTPLVRRQRDPGSGGSANWSLTWQGKAMLLLLLSTAILAGLVFFFVAHWLRRAEEGKPIRR